MAFNFGISLELTLKLLHVESTQENHSHIHTYAEIFFALPRSVQNDVNAIYSNFGKKLHFIALRLTKENVPPAPPESEPLDTFELVLSHFDRLRLYLQRYSAEQFDPEVWAEFPYPLTGWIDLLGEMLKYSESLSVQTIGCEKSRAKEET